MAAGPVHAEMPVIRCGESRVAESPRTADFYTFVAKAGEVLTIGVHAEQCGATPAPWWRLYALAPNGAIVPTSDGAKRCFGRCETAPLPVDGSYFLMVVDPGGKPGRLYRLAVAAVSATANGRTNGPPRPTCAGTRPIVLGQQLEDSLEPNGDIDAFTFDAEAGARLRIGVGPTSESGIRWELFDPAGTRVTFGNGERFCTGPCDMALGPAGVYTIVASDLGCEGVRAYALTLAAMPIPTTTTTTPPTTTTTVPPALPSPPRVTLGRTLRRLPSVGAPGEALGASVLARGMRLVIGAPHEGAGGPDAGAALVLDVAGVPGTPGFGGIVRVLLPADPVPGGRFGAALASVGEGAGDGLVVGAPGDVATQVGAAYLFRSLEDRAPLRLTVPTLVAGSEVGAAVAVVAGHVAVGAPGAPREGVPGTGGVLLFDPAGDFTGSLVAPDVTTGDDRFGTALAVTVDGLAVGAPGRGPRAGRVVAFAGVENDVRFVVQSPQPEVGDGFGAALASAGRDLVVGAPGTSGGAGAVHLVGGERGVVRAIFTSPTPTPGGAFGAAVAVRDGVLLVGAPGEGAGGRVHRFDLAQGALLETIESTAGGAPGDGFGAALAGLGDGRVLVGAPGSDLGSIDGGAAVLVADGVTQAVFRNRLPAAEFGAAVAGLGGDVVVGAPRDAGGTGAVQRFPALDVDAGAAVITSPVGGMPNFGRAVAALGDTIVVGGAPDQDEAAGAVHLFDGTALLRSLAAPGAQAGDQFGFSVAPSGTSLVVGAPLAGPLDSGIAFLVDPATGNRQVTYQKPSPMTGDFFGASVAADGGTILVGAPSDRDGTAPTGAAYLYARDTAVLLATLVNPTGVPNELFGAAVALGTAHAAIGAPMAGAGRVYVFDRLTGMPLLVLDHPNPMRGGGFGSAVAFFGDAVLVGAPRDDSGSPDTGAAYLFDLGSGTLRQTLANPATGAFDHFGAAVAAGAGGLLVGAPGASRVYEYVPVVAPAGRFTAGVTQARVAATASGTCGNGLIEPGEVCDDGNTVDGDDCKADCSGTLCCTVDPAAAARCDDANPCTDDLSDPVSGCSNVDNGRCCITDADCPDSGQCRTCVGCFLYDWDCCDRGSICLVVSKECAGTRCFGQAMCECSGGLTTCDGEPVPAAVRQSFENGCNGVRLQTSVAPNISATPKDLVRSARKLSNGSHRELRKAIRAARKLRRRKMLSPACTRQIVAEIRQVKRTVPRAQRLRRCVLQQTG
ncbi:MAG: hypothetical protein KIT14_09905 [bacterium]|nr:hypothetical protein [bacterium]